MFVVIIAWWRRKVSAKHAISGTSWSEKLLQFPAEHSLMCWTHAEYVQHLWMLTWWQCCRHLSRFHNTDYLRTRDLLPVGSSNCLDFVT